jgi:DNA-binding NtrC family response regulator
MDDILIVDDDPSILSTLREILEVSGYSVQTAGDGARAIAMVKEAPYRIALLDIKLPDMEGPELLAGVRKIRPALRCIMVTGFASLENAVESLNAGAAAYVMKPVNPKDLLDTIREKIAEQEAEEEITGDRVADWAADQLLRLS